MESVQERGYNLRNVPVFPMRDETAYLKARIKALESQVAQLLALQATAMQLVSDAGDRTQEAHRIIEAMVDVQRLEAQTGWIASNYGIDIDEEEGGSPCR